MYELLIKETADGSADSICCSMSFTYSLVTWGTPAISLKLYVMTILSLYKITSRTNVFIMSFLTFKSVVSAFIDSVSENMVTSFNRYIEEVNKVSKQTFISDELMNIQDVYLDDYNNDGIYDYIVRQFENYNSSLMVGMGYIPFSEGYRCNDIVYSGTRTLTFNYSTDSSRRLVDSIVEKSNDSIYGGGRMYLIYDDSWDMHIFARVVKDIRIDHFDTVGGLGFLVVNSSVFRQQKKYGEVVKGFSSFVLYDGVPILNEEIPTDLLSDKSYYVHKTSFSQYCEYYGFFRESAVLQDMLLDSVVMLSTFALVLILFITVYKRNHDKWVISSSKSRSLE